jgi:hypothetical protein
VTSLRRLALLVGSLTVAASSLAAHDLFLKLNTYFLPAETAVRVPVLNGTFSKSESVVARDRVAGLTLVGPAGSTPLDTLALTARGDTSFISLHTGAAGTYVLGLSVKPRDVDYTGAEFNAYLKAEGYADVLSERLRTGDLSPGKRRYATHVKAVVQVGGARSEAYSAVLGFPAEIVPLDNPYGLTRGATLRLRFLIDGQPAVGVVGTAGGEGRKGATIKEIHLTTDAKGIAHLPLTDAGRWGVKFAKMRRSALQGLNYESQRTTLTFEVR